MHIGFIHKLYIVVYLLILCASSQSTASSPISSCDFPYTELQSLYSLYNQTNGISWDWQVDYQSAGVPWNFSVAIPNPCTQRWQGINCTYANNASLATGSWCGVNRIQLQGYNLMGALTYTTWSFTQLQVLLLADSPYLVGRLPASMMRLTTLQELSLFNNNLTGTIPNEIGGLEQLQVLKLYINHLRGSIPPAITSLQHLATLHLYLNDLSGSIPDNIGNLKTLQDLGLEGNRLVGTLPASITQLTELTRLEVNVNFLSGSIPTGIGALSKLVFLQLYSNAFTGSIPASIGDIYTIKYLFLQENFLEGSVPTSILRIPALMKLFLFANLLTESLTGSTLSSNLDSFDLHANFFTGSIPTTWSNTPYMKFFYLYDNLFFGKIPSNLFHTNISIIRLDDNNLIGTIPSTVGDASNCRLFNASYNYLLGTLPRSIAQMQRMIYFDVSYNLLGGRVDDLVANMTKLTVLLLNNNHFSGPLTSLVHTESQRSLGVIDVSSNYFTRTLPSSFFHLANLSILAVVENCITGSLPDNVCQGSAKLVTLALDGLHTASTCQSKFFPGVAQSEAYTLTQPLRGSIPSCLFNAYPRLRTLHLSGNGISASLPHISSISASLRDLSLSHNQMVGRIPLSIQQHPWTNLDLSFNKFTGMLDDSLWSSVSTNSTAELHLDINRLSGEIPRTLRNVQTISLLQGNLFDCDADKSSLPLHDNAFHSYECGSNTVNNSMYIYVAVVGMVLLLTTLMYVVIMRNKVDCCGIRDSMKYIGHQLIQCWEVYNSKEAAVFLGLQVEQLYGLGVMLKQFRRWIVSLAAIIALIFIPTYIVLTSKYSTYEYTYAWTWSLSYLSGIPSAVICLVLLSVLLSLIYMDALSFMRFNVHRLLTKISDKSKHLRVVNNDDDDQQQQQQQQSPGSRSSGGNTVELDRRLKHSLLWVGVFLFNIATVLAVNMGYVLAANDRSINTNVKQTIAVLVSIYKIVWTNMLFELFQTIMIKDIAMDHDVREEFYASFAAYMTWLSLFNNILAPCISVAVVSADCFYYALFAAPQVDTSFEVALCEVEFDETFFSMNAYCGDYTTLHTYYAPPFSYSYQCGSSLMAAFADVFVYRYLIAGFLVPCAILLLKCIQEKSVHLYGPDSTLFQACTFVLPNMYKPIPNVASSAQQVEEVVSEDGRIEVTMKIPQKIFKAENIFIALITDVSVMLTFGVIFPPIAILGCVSILCHSYFVQVAVGRLVVLAKTQGIMKPFIAQVNDECKGIRGLLVRSLSSMSLLLAFVWSIFLFDTLGYNVGVYRALWIVIVMLCFPLVIQAVNLYHAWYRSTPASRQGNNTVEEEEDGEVAVEMTSMGTVYSPNSKTKKSMNVVENPLRMSEDQRKSDSFNK